MQASGCNIYFFSLWSIYEEDLNDSGWLSQDVDPFPHAFMKLTKDSSRFEHVQPVGIIGAANFVQGRPANVTVRLP